VTGAQFRAAIVRLGLSQLAAARLLGIDGRTCRRYIRGDLKIPPPLARLLVYIERYGPGLAAEWAAREKQGEE